MFINASFFDWPKETPNGKTFTVMVNIVLYKLFLFFLLLAEDKQTLIMTN